MEPLNGSVAGGTYITITGYGFTPDMTVSFGSSLASEITVLDAFTATCLTPTHIPGVYPVTLQSGEQLATAPNFSFYNPANQYGGVWGEEILGSINISVYTYGNGTPIEEAFVMLTTNPETQYQGYTNASGQITISGPELQGRQTITVAKEWHESNSIVTVDAENVTIFLKKQERGSGSRDPIPLGTIYGEITGVDKVTDIDPGNEIEMATVFTTQEDPWWSNPWPGDQNSSFGNGQYELISRLGDVAVIGLCGVYETDTGDFIPHYMAVERFLFVTSDQSYEVNLDCNIPLGQQQIFRLVDPPYSETGPNINRIDMFLNFGFEGVFGGIFMGEGTSEVVVVEHLPALEGTLTGMDFFVIGGAYTGWGAPYSRSIVEDVILSEDTVTIAPMLGIPELIDPPTGNQLVNRHMEWQMSNSLSPDMFVVRITLFDSTPIWTLYLPGTSREFLLPEFPLDAGTDSLPETTFRITIFALDIAGDFDFDAFNFSHLNISAWHSWSAVYDSFENAP